MPCRTSQTIINENPRKSPSAPPNSDTKDSTGQSSCSVLSRAFVFNQTRRSTSSILEQCCLLNADYLVINLSYCQAQFKSSSISVQLRTKTGLIITVRPTHPGQVPRKLKFGTQANFTTIRCFKVFQTGQLYTSTTSCSQLWLAHLFQVGLKLCKLNSLSTQQVQ